VVRRNWRELSAIAGLELLDTPEDQTYALNQFYDTGYHLTESAATERTRRIIQSLKQRMLGPGPAASTNLTETFGTSSQ
jgi:hypothetical protein